MPVIFRERGYRFFFYSNEGDPREPAHVHVVKDGIDAKFWLVPTVSLAYNDGHSARALRELIEIIRQRRQECLEAWHDFFTDRDPRPLR